MEKSSFFNSVLDQSGNPDRPYLAEDFARYFSAIIGNGIFPNPSNNLQAISNNNMTITIKQGKAWINGYFYYNTDDLILPIEVADGVLNRIDRIVLRLDFINREIKAKVKKGTFASSPTAPTLQRDADAYELALADIAVNKGTISITQGSITDKRLDNSLCGIVHGVVDQVDITTLFNQYTVGFQQKEQQFEQEFQTWFATIQGQLSGDVAGNLSNQILNLAGAGRTTETVKGNADAIKTLTTQMGEMTTDVNNIKTNKADKTDLNTKVNNTDYSKLHVYVPTITGSSTAYVGSVDNGQTTYVDGQPFTIIPNVDCGNAPTFNFNNIGALTIVKQDGSAVSTGDIKANKPLSLVRVGSSFFIRSSGGGSNIKSIQHIATSMAFNELDKTINISSIDINKTLVIIEFPVGLNPSALIAYNFTSSTKLTLSRATGGSAVYNIIVTIIEFTKVKSSQRGFANLTNVTAYSTNITPVDVSKSIVTCYTVSNNTANNVIGSFVCTVDFMYSGSHITVVRDTNSSYYSTAFWHVLEFE